MFNRIKKYLTYKFVTYVPGISKLAIMEAKRLSQYIFDNYDSHQQLIIIEEIKLNLIELKQNQIKDETVKLLQIQNNLKCLEINLNKLQTN